MKIFPNQQFIKTHPVKIRLKSINFASLCSFGNLNQLAHSKIASLRWKSFFHLSSLFGTNPSWARRGFFHLNSSWGASKWNCSCKRILGVRKLGPEHTSRSVPIPLRHPLPTYLASLYLPLFRLVKRVAAMFLDPWSCMRFFD